MFCSPIVNKEIHGWYILIRYIIYQWMQLPIQTVHAFLWKRWQPQMKMPNYIIRALIFIKIDWLKVDIRPDTSLPQGHVD